MSHTSRAPRDANLLAALALAVTDRVAAATEAAAGLGASAPAALAALDGPASGASIDALRGGIGLTHSGCVRLVDRLAAAGLVERRVGADGRAVALVLTPPGRRLARRVRAAREGAVEALLAGLGGREREALAGLSATLLAQLAESGASRDAVCRLCDRDACERSGGGCPVAAALKV